MATHLVLSRVYDVASFEREVEAGLRPRHVQFDVAAEIGATLWFIGERHTGLDRPVDWFVTKLTGTPGMFRTARRLAVRLGDDDVVFCPEIFGLFLSLLLVVRRVRPHIVLDVMVPSRPRLKASFRRGFFRRRIDQYFVNSQEKAETLMAYGVDGDRIAIPPSVTDERFMSPGDHELDRDDPVVVSSGREQRDYVTLADALGDRPMTVRVCAASANVTRKQAIALPDRVPDNFEIRHFDWPEYRELFRGADVVVVPLLEHDYSAGLTVIYEAFAFGKPVIATQTRGVMSQLVEAGAVIGVPVGDAPALRKAVETVLSERDVREDLARRGNEFFLAHATTAGFIDWMVAHLSEQRFRAKGRPSARRFAPTGRPVESGAA
ncbi:MAG: glycosyltransferase family 4 protein [Microthrixaceae bacterium]